MIITMIPRACNVSWETIHKYVGLLYVKKQFLISFVFNWICGLNHESIGMDGIA